MSRYEHIFFPRLWRGFFIGFTQKATKSHRPIADIHSLSQQPVVPSGVDAQTGHRNLSKVAPFLVFHLSTSEIMDDKAVKGVQRFWNIYYPTNCRHTKTLATLACLEHALASLWDKPTQMFGKCHLSNVRSRCQRLDISSWKRVTNQNQSEWKPSYFLGRVFLCWIHTIALHALCLQIPPQNAWTLPGILKITWLVIFKWYKPQNSLHYSYLFSWKYILGSPQGLLWGIFHFHDFGVLVHPPCCTCPTSSPGSWLHRPLQKLSISHIFSHTPWKLTWRWQNNHLKIYIYIYQFVP